ncbi:UPF0489 family protein [Dehalobacterium formicoaceticum]|uniref:UPF0489 family protein n=1 Tax=Dehalobacterium formicoaceticum TaxID=51515 RepID=A0ABT1Y8K5_9FIRM|nr:UPF0489 family protein [Dehalobacterium formicoaceticum]MCR6547217.1 UPF0489 family protein [Dehalobacterium formicoaceticum]
MMKILDIDLDFFLNKIAYDVDDTCGLRLSSEEYLVDSKENVKLFLEKQCGLSLENKVPGKVVNHHNEALYVWNEMIKNHLLKKPFNITHVDAHPDLWFGDCSITYIMTELTRLPLANRNYIEDVDESKIKCGNYLIFAIALGWVDSLEFVYHEKWEGEDLHKWFFKDFDFRTLQIELKNFSYEVYRDNMDRLKQITPLNIDPAIPFKAVPKQSFSNNDKYDFVILSKSPGYTPETADSLIPVIQEYFTDI